MTALAPTLQAFFVGRLLAQRGASPHTIAAYQDTFRLLLGFAAARTKKAPATLDLGDLDGPLVAAFLDISSMSAATGRAPGTTGSRRSTPCSSMPPER